ncbi:hypothetical protein P2318_07810 [Myxococcaceae bacterium GXIMD 01537]
MLLRSTLTCLLLLGALVPLRRARACGPDFPPHLLKDRAETLAKLPDGAFLLEATRLVPKPAESFAVVEVDPEPEGARVGGGARETELYAAGAKAYNAGDWREGQARFREVLALPAEERRRFSTFAAFMLGRIEESAPEAQRRFAEVRELARQGFDDPLGLAVASLGEEARHSLRSGDDVAALRLYAQQAAHGSQSGAISLLHVARALARDEARMERALKDPLGQRLLATYAWTRGRESLWVDGADGPSPTPLPRLLEALAAVPGLAGADRLAAAAWIAGRFDLAERFAGQERTPLAAWVKSKLALRRGDRTAAEAHLAEAREALPEEEDWQGESYESQLRPRARAEGEWALLALMRGDFPEAAERMLRTCSWPDIAYLAERVMTEDELRRFIATHSTPPGPRCQPERAPGWGAEEKAPGALQQLRVLFGRRLLRAGQGQEALEYFRGTPWEEPSRQYVEAMERARSAWSDVDKAQALYSASLLARRVGMELMGTELAPDWTWVGGSYDLTTWYEDMRRYALESEEQPPHVARERAALEALPLITEAERQRSEAHGPKHPVRFHYRSTAADLAEEAAALLPPRSQAAAALLCHAARFASYSEPERVQRLWRHYIRTGALDAGVDQFGQSCPEPNFERVRQQRLTLSWPNWRMRTLATVAGGVMLLPIAGAFYFVRRKRRDTVPTNPEP